MKNSDIPKTIALWLRANQDKVESFDMEYDQYGAEDGHDWSIWVYLKYGNHNGDPGAHIIHEYLVKDFMERAKWIGPCDCDECKKHLEDK